ncbi:branched-chain amino acid ABC transporter permease [Acuticoccus sp. I52.16.1]|uniref:branched-chain amino acid ABC transporter permease n=1 Tax=Acuticoccus sp. I52.16.1 TaxID=2928472 RepID=UPI001FD14034|nr:branched-chain amino acid ABC transporter permease [Acuticoccus sp. I52.16.1]UOM35725.1 branched-chain amino acid ABC transporter permease [Acuticoccus sp. I52.16.1]
MSGPRHRQRDPAERRVAVIVAGLGALLVLFLAAVPYVLPMFTNPFWVSVTAEILIWSLLAVSVNLLFGYTGLLSFGQALYFGFGMYGVAIGVAQLGLGFWPAFGFGILVSVAMAAVSGALAVRLTWHYFAIITVVFSLIFYFLALTMKPLTGGDDGLGFSLPVMFRFGETEIGLTDPTVQYYFIFITVAACLLLMRIILRSPFGRALVAIRENDVRAELVGINVYAMRLASFVVAGMFAGIAGALFAFFGRYASASYMFYHVSGEAVVWAIVGGSGTLLGPVIGAGLLIVIREELSLYWDHYLLLVGAIVILTVIFAPKGIAGLVIDLVERIAGPRREAEDETRGPAE